MPAGGTCAVNNVSRETSAKRIGLVSRGSAPTVRRTGDEEMHGDPRWSIRRDERTVECQVAQTSECLDSVFASHTSDNGLSAEIAAHNVGRASLVR